MLAQDMIAQKITLSRQKFIGRERELLQSQALRERVLTGYPIVWSFGILKSGVIGQNGPLYGLNKLAKSFHYVNPSSVC